MIAGVKLHVLSVVHSYNKTNCQRQLHSPTKSQMISLSIKSKLNDNCNKSKNLNKYNVEYPKSNHTTVSGSSAISNLNSEHGLK